MLGLLGNHPTMFSCSTTKDTAYSHLHNPCPELPANASEVKATTNQHLLLHGGKQATQQPESVVGYNRLVMCAASHFTTNSAK
jgi:hypothetical protein